MMTRHSQSVLQLNQMLAAFVCVLISLTIPAYGIDKWSRQIEATGPGQADSFSDWVPLAQPVDGSPKEREARVLTYSQSFPPNGRFGELQKPQQSFDYPFQLQRFANPQHQQQQQQQLRQSSAPVASALKSQEPTSQSFFKFEMPFRNEGNNRPVGGPPSLQTGYQIQHTFGGGAQATLFNSPYFSQQPVFPPEFHPIPQKPLSQPLQKQKPLHQQNFIDDTFPLKNHFREGKPQSPQQSLQAVSPQVFPVDPQSENGFELNKPSTFHSQPDFQHAGNQNADPNAAANAGQQEVQLLYVPYDTLYNQQRPQGPATSSNPSFEVNKFNFNPGLPAVNPYQINQFYTQDPLAPQDPNFYATSTTSRPLGTSHKPSTIFQDFLIPQTTTAKPKPKAHQPPLAMFLVRSSARPTQSEVVTSLRNANTVEVIDAPTKSIPEIFVGPAGMPIPEGYVKFDLPYLSQLTHTRDLSDVPFFVAPLSYRTPNGFHKILLPEPHVGSIVINHAKGNPAGGALDFNSNVNKYQTNAPRTRPTQHRTKPPVSNAFYGDNLRETDTKTSNLFEVTTQRATLQPTRGNKFNYFYDQDQAIREINSPKINKQERPKKKRPQNTHIQTEQPNFGQPIGGPYQDFRPTINNNYQRPTTSSSTTHPTSTTTTSTSTTSAPTNLFNYNTSPQVEFQSTNGQLYHDLSEVKAPVEQEYAPRFTTRPPPTTLPDDEYQMKQYFRQQDAFRSRPQLIQTTNSPYEQVQYTPVQLDYDREINAPPTTHKTTTTTKHRVTYYTPSATPASPTTDTFNTLPPHENVGEYGSVQTEIKKEKPVPSNHRPSYNQNEILDGTVEYEPNPYQLPSELPTPAANIPGLINDLQDKSKLRPSEQLTTTTTAINEPEPPTRPTRRPINRIRKPVVTKVTSSVSYSESETSTRRPARPERVRRPYGTRGSDSGNESVDNNDSSSITTKRPSSVRNSLVRNPNRVRYQPTNEERQSYRIKQRKHGSKKGGQDEDIDYQRDVLKQNYPVFKGRRPTSPTAIPSSYVVSSTEGATSESQQIYTVTPSNNVEQNEQTFPAGILEPMQIAQQYNEFSKDNYGPGYFPNQEDLSPTEPVYRNEVNPVYTTLPSSTSTTTVAPRTTTTEEPVATTRRSPFVRRNFPKLRTTTEAAITTTTTAPEERSTRPRIPPRKVIKVRTRTRRPSHPASSTNAPEEEEVPHEEKKNNYRKLSRFNSDLYENDSPRRRYKSKFQLEGQESQWSPAVKSQNHFQPLSHKEKIAEDEHKYEQEPEIVTADPNAENDNSQKPETYEINVSANFGPSDNLAKTTIKAPNLKPEKSFAELLEEVMGKAPEEKPIETESETQSTDGTFFESQKTTTTDRLNRRGKWRKTQTSVRNNESFETAESQNIGAQLFNSLNAAAAASDDKSPVEHRAFKSTTPMSTPTTEIVQVQNTTPPTPQPTVDEYQLTTTTEAPTTPKYNEFTTYLPQFQDNAEITTFHPDMDQLPADDLETQPSLFSEVKKQLHDLFAIDENEDDRAVTAALAAVGRRRQDYMNIKRERPTTTEMTPADSTTQTSESVVTTDDNSQKTFHKNLMDHVVYATSTSTKVTSETEICYRGRCIRSEDLPANHKLN